MTSPRLRLDQLLVERGFYASRARARDAVARGQVRVGGQTIDKPAHSVTLDAEIAIADPAAGYVSRSALKLKAVLEAFQIPVADRICLDVGASTGGFTQVLLEAGATHVTAIDVGHGQLSPVVAFDPRVTSIEGLNARDLTREHLGAPPDLVVADVSFISLKLALPPALDLARSDAYGAFLVKPQFEVGRAHVGKGGIVRDEAQAIASVDGIAVFLQSSGWRVIGRITSPIAGADGNQEYLIAAQKTQSVSPS
jgi:23S rRNA (cytidine1920-2'-O)/16S rRNA (cytidine1409-2'-O)-methyltransferase